MIFVILGVMIAVAVTLNYARNRKSVLCVGGDCCQAQSVPGEFYCLEHIPKGKSWLS
jgi:hypothetical protein